MSFQILYLCFSCSLRNHDKQPDREAQSNSTSSSAETQDYTYVMDQPEKTNELDYHTERSTRTRVKYQELIKGFQTKEDKVNCHQIPVIDCKIHKGSLKYCNGLKDLLTKGSFSYSESDRERCFAFMGS